MRLIMGLDAPSGGDVTVNGRHCPRPVLASAEVGALPESGPSTPGEVPRLTGRCWQRRAPSRDPGVDEVTEMAGLTSVSRRRAGKFSLGMTQRLGMAAALVIGGVMLVKRAA